MKILIEKTVIEQALEALEYLEEFNDGTASVALREALDPELQFVRDWNEGKVRRVYDGKVMGLAEQAEQEPVAWKDLTYGNLHHQDFGNSIPLYAAPVRTKDLTDEEIMDLVRDECVDMRWPSTPLFIARAVIAADRERNR